MYNIFSMLSWNTLSCSVLPLSFRFSIWAKHPQNLLVSLWIVDHRLFKEFLVRLNFLSLRKVNQILSQNVVCFWSVDVMASKLTLSHANTTLMSSSTVKLIHRWPLLVVDFFAMGGIDCPISTWGGDWWTFTFECGVDIKILLSKDSKPCSLSCKMLRKKGFWFCESIT